MENIKSSKIVDLAKSEITRFTPMYERSEQKAILEGLFNSTLLNYGRSIVKISLYFNIPTIALVEEYVYNKILLNSQN